MRREHARRGKEPMRAPDDLVALPLRGPVATPLLHGVLSPTVPLVQRGTGMVTLQARVAGHGGLVVYVTRERGRVQPGDLVALLLPHYAGVVQVVRMGKDGRRPEATRAVGSPAANFALLRFPQVNRVWVFVHGKRVSVGLGESPGQFTAAATADDVPEAAALRYVSLEADAPSPVHGVVWNVQSWAAR